MASPGGTDAVPEMASPVSSPPPASPTAEMAMVYAELQKLYTSSQQCKRTAPTEFFQSVLRDLRRRRLDQDGSDEPEASSPRAAQDSPLSMRDGDCQRARRTSADHHDAGHASAASRPPAGNDHAEREGPSQTEDSFVDMPGDYRSPDPLVGQLSLHDTDNVEFLGHFLPAADWHALDRAKIDLRLYHPSLDRPLLRTAIARAYAFICGLTTLDGRAVNMSPVRRLRVRMAAEVDQVLTNVLAGRTQLGKTETMAAVLYVCSIGLGLVGVGLTRSPGGTDAMQSLKNNILAVQNAVCGHLRAVLPELTPVDLAFFAPEVVEAKKYATQLRRESGLGVGSHGMRGLIMIDRQNVSTLDRVFLNADSAFACLSQRHDQAMMVGHVFMRYALVLDEDDEATGSASRKKNRTELKSHHVETSYGYSPPGSATWSSSDGEGSSDDETDPEQELSAGEVLANRTVRGQAYLVVAATATWIALAMYDEEAVNQPLNIIPMPLKEFYVGLFSSDVVEPQHPKHLRIIWKRTQSPTRQVGDSIKSMYNGALTEIMQTLQNRYSQIRTATSTVAGEPPHPQPAGRHVSLHVNVPRSKSSIKNANLLCAELVQEYTHVPLAAFAWNSGVIELHLSQKLMASLSSKRRWQQHDLCDVVRTTLAATATEWKVPPTVQASDTGGRVISFQFAARHRLISRVYDVVQSIFAEAKAPVFAVCVTGHMGGRGLTMKSTDHSVFLTDQFFDVASCVPVGGQRSSSSHFELIVQVAGRLCSVHANGADARVRRTLWTTEESERELKESLGTYEDLMKIVAKSPEANWTLKTLAEKVECSQPSLARAIASGRYMTRRPVQDPVQSAMAAAYAVSEAATLIPVADDQVTHGVSRDTILAELRRLQTRSSPESHGVSADEIARSLLARHAIQVVDQAAANVVAGGVYTRTPNADTSPVVATKLVHGCLQDCINKGLHRVYRVSRGRFLQLLE